MLIGSASTIQQIQVTDVKLILQETQRLHQRTNSRDPSLSKSVVDSPQYSSVLCSPKDGGTGAPSSPSSYTALGGRKDSPVIQQRCPSLSGQLNLQESPGAIPRPGQASSTSPTPRAGSKSRLSDSKYRKTSQLLCSRHSPHDRMRANKAERELEEDKKSEHKQKYKVLKKEKKGDVPKTDRQGEDRKRRKKKEEKKLAEKKKKRDKASKRERKLAFKVKATEEEMLSSISASCAREAKISKIETLGLVNQGQSPPKHKHRERNEHADKTAHRSSTSTLHPRSTSQQPLSKSENHKMPKKRSSPPGLPLPKETSPHQTSKQSSQLEPKAKPEDQLPSLLFKALAPLSAACSISSEQQSGQGGVLNAPDLQPVAVLGNLREIGDNLANTPPVLSWQGSPVSVLGEDEEELEKGVISRPVLQPSPTQCFSPPPVESESIDNINTDDRSHSSMSELSDLPCKTEQASDDEKEEVTHSSEKVSGSLLHELHQDNAGLDDVFESLATFLGSQRVACRGGPFGGPPAGATKGVKYSSSLALDPDIHCPENQDFSPISSPAASSESSNQSPTHTTSDTLVEFHSPADVSEPATSASVQEKEEENESDDEEKQDDGEIPQERTEPSLLDESLSAELTLTTTHTVVKRVKNAASIEGERGNVKKKERTGKEKKRKQTLQDGKGEGAIKIKIKRKENKVISCKVKTSDGKDAKESDVLSSVPLISDSARPVKDGMKGQIPQENQTPRGKDSESEKVDAGNLNTTTDKRKEAAELDSETARVAGNADAITSNSASAVSTNASKLDPPVSASKVDPLKLKALSMGLSKELKILLIKVESGGRQTFNISEVEEQRIPIPLSKISITNTGAEVIRACK